MSQNSLIKVRGARGVLACCILSIKHPNITEKHEAFREKTRKSMLEKAKGLKDRQAYIFSDIKFSWMYFFMKNMNSSTAWGK
jgi:hypothetical protein